jgi:hypothetical protein
MTLHLKCALVGCILDPVLLLRKEREREREKMCDSVVQVTCRDKKKEWKTRMEAASMKASDLLPLSYFNFSTTNKNFYHSCVSCPQN